MQLITKEIMDKLKNNDQLDIEDNDNGELPLKLFNASGGQTWLIHSIEEDGDIMWGLADLGFGCVEYGTISLNEMLETKNKLGFRFMLERDMHWKGGNVSNFIGKENLAGC
jgi:hypothetical protein